jgi:hypothetical protein
MEEIDIISSLDFTMLKLYVPTSLSTGVSPIPLAIGFDAIAFNPYEIQWGRS